MKIRSHMHRILSYLALSCLALSSVLIGAQPVFAQAASAKPAVLESDSGKAVYYSTKFNGRKTASGERFNSNAMIAAHRSLPFGTKVLVTHIKTKKSVVLRIVDRGPSQPHRIIDVSRAAAVKLGFVKAGTAEVSVKVVGRVPGKSAVSAPKKFPAKV